MNVNKAAIKALYHCGRSVELNIQQDPNSLQVCKQGHTVNFWGIREEIRQTLGRMKRGEGGWRIGILDGGRIGGLEGWRVGGLEGWRIGGLSLLFDISFEGFIM